MHLAVYLPLLFPVLAALAAGPLSRRLEPRLATWLMTIAALVLATSSTLVLGLLALSGLVRIPLVAALKDYSPDVIAREDPAAWPAALAGAILLTLAAIATVRLTTRRTGALWSAALEAACLPGPDPVVVTDDDSADAYTMPGLPGRIVISHGMLDALDPAGQQILLAHEHAHLDHHHYAFISLSQLAAAANPLLRPLAGAVAYTVERWADEHAAQHTGNRRAVAETVAKAAVATKRTRARRRIPPAALGILGRPATPGPVPRRVAALLSPPPHSPPVLLLAASMLLAASGLCALEAVHDLHQFLELAHAH
ncbi:M48 family metalloprotease [Streptomyces sp. H39-S7]|uniref:M48 family metalloprotease n=1 Tax=Streptomyces sp. H39-S7 TaxID=3004357 RepID=UPI0022B05DE0|nr:M48 family metalloprotease [Streptomyces sp. H39-S7]MCZ4124033.1 M48 family metalloprotease [Streptomyces sp. H39-S7]